VLWLITNYWGSDSLISIFNIGGGEVSSTPGLHRQWTEQFCRRLIAHTLLAYITQADNLRQLIRCYIIELMPTNSSTTCIQHATIQTFLHSGGAGNINWGVQPGGLGVGSPLIGSEATSFVPRGAKRHFGELSSPAPPYPCCEPLRL